MQQLVSNLLDKRSTNVSAASGVRKRSKLNVWSLSKNGQLMSWLELVYAQLQMDQTSTLRTGIEQAIDTYAGAD